MKEFVGERANRTGHKHSELGIYFRDLRRRTGLSQRKVGEAMGYPSGQFISSLERGISFWQVSRLRELHEFYRGDVRTLIALTIDSERSLLKKTLKAPGR